MTGPPRTARRPSATPSSATNTKLTELLIRKNATERRAIRCPGIPALTQDPGAEREAARAAGRHQRADSDLGPRKLLTTASTTSSGRRRAGTSARRSRTTAPRAPPPRPASQAPRRSSRCRTSPRPGRQQHDQHQHPYEREHLQEPAQETPRRELFRQSRPAPPLASALAGMIWAFRVGALKAIESRSGGCAPNPPSYMARVSSTRERTPSLA